jgi:integrase
MKLTRRSFTRPIPPNAIIITRKGQSFAKLVGPDGKPVEHPVTANGTRIRIELPFWYADWRDDSGKRHRKRLCENKSAAQIMLGQLAKKLADERAGIVDIFEVHRRRPIGEHVDDFHADLIAKGRTTTHAAKTRAMVRSIVKGCGFAFLGDLSASRVQSFLGDLREPKRIPDVPPAPWISATDAAKLLDISREFLARQVARHGVERKVVDREAFLERNGVVALLLRQARGAGEGTINHYVTAMKAFARWCVKDRRMPDNPLGHLSAGNADADRRHERRALEPNELRLLLEAASNSRDVYRGLTGRDRFILYTVAVFTGLRAGELASLTPTAFDLDSSPAVLRLEAATAKNRREANQPLPAEIVASLAEYLDGRPERVRLWPGEWNERAAEMIRRDLEAAGLAYEDADGRVADFHSLRASYITMLARSGVHPRTAQELARHSDVRLTMKVYTHLTMRDLSGAVATLPKLLPESPRALPLAATGTDGAGEVGSSVLAHCLPKTCPKGADSSPLQRFRPENVSEPHTADDGADTAENTGKTAKTPVFSSVPTIGASRIRTGNRAIMSRLL